eukprot:Em0016g677a
MPKNLTAVPPSAASVQMTIATHGENCWKLLDVEPFHGFVVSDYIALFCVNRAHLGVPWRIGEKEKAMEIDRLHEDEVLSLSWIRLTRG